MINLKIQPEIQSQPDFLTFGKPDIGEQEIEAVNAVLRSAWLSTGPKVKEFESEFEQFIGNGYAVALASCTDALRLAMIASNVGPGKEVITTPLTYAATVNAILSVGAKPVFVDVLQSGQIDHSKIEAKITSATAAIIPVHYTGAPADTIAIMDIAKRHGLVVIEDAAHGFGGWHEGTSKRIGTFGDFSCFSFYATKNITSGEGGMVMCRSKEMAERIKTLSMQGLSSGAWRRYGSGPIKTYEVSYAGQKANMSDVHAAIGLTQLRRWPELRAKRDAIWKVYENAFGKKEVGHSQHLFTILHAYRDSLREYLHKQGIGTGVHFNSLNLEPAYANLNGYFPVADGIGRETVSLPISTTMTVEDAQRVVLAVKEFELKGERDDD